MQINENSIVLKIPCLIIQRLVSLYRNKDSSVLNRSKSIIAKNNMINIYFAVKDKCIIKFIDYTEDTPGNNELHLLSPSCIHI